MKQYFILRAYYASKTMQNTKCHLIIPNFDKVTPHYARSTRKFLHFTTHFPQCTNFYYLTINTGLKHTNTGV